MPIEHPDEEAIFNAAKEQPDALSARVYLDEFCAGDSPLRERIERLLDLSKDAKDFFERQSDCRSALEDTFLGKKAAEGLLPRLEDYEVLEEVGRGGAGVVYKARQRSLARLVAIKFLLPGPLATPSYVQRFRVEASAAASLRHPNIVAVHEVGVKEGYHYLVMDYIAGQTLAKFSDNQPLPPLKAASLVKTIAEAIHFAHAHQVLHRDLKPSNVLIDQKDQPHVTDFGLAKRLDEGIDLTLSGQILGSPGYMSPEQASGKRGLVGRSTDVYSLGAILFQLLTGRPPFVAETIGDTIQLVLECEPITPRTLVLGIPRDLETICVKCLRKEPGRRYASAGELAEELGRFLNHEPIRARPSTQLERFWRWCRRHRGVASLGAATVLLLLTIVVSSPIALYRINKARQRAEHQERAARHSAYVANMNLVQHAWEHHNIGLVQQVLRETTSELERGFEWFYWQNEIHRDLRTLRGHTNSVNAALFSPDGQWLATASDDGTAKIWEAATGQEVRTLKEHSASVKAVAFSPDGRRIATASMDHTAKVWERSSGKVLLTLRGHQGMVLAVAFSPDGQRLLTGGWDRTARVWELTSGKELLRLTNHLAAVISVAFSPDGQSIATGSEDNTVKVWDAASGHESRTISGAEGGAISLAFSKDNRTILSASHYGRARLWDAASGRLLQVIDNARCAAFSPDGQFIATGSTDEIVRIWDAASTNELHRFHGHGDWLQSVAFSPDGARIVSASRDWTVKVWEAFGREEPITFREVFRTDGGGGTAAFSPDGQQLVTCGADETTRVWDARSGRQLFELRGHQSWVRSVAFSRDGKRIATGAADGTGLVWDVATRKPLSLLRGHIDTICSVSFSPDGQRIVSASGDRTARVWSAINGECLLVLEHRAPVASMALSPDGQRILTGAEDGRVAIWELASGKPVLDFQAHDSGVYSVAFSPDEQRIVTTGDRRAKVWDARTGGLLLELRLNMLAWATAFSPDGQRILTGSGGGILSVSDAATGKPLLDLNAHLGRIRVVAFSPDGQRILTGSEDHTVKIWEGATAEQVAAWQKEEAASPLNP